MILQEVQPPGRHEPRLYRVVQGGLRAVAAPGYQGADGRCVPSKGGGSCISACTPGLTDALVSGWWAGRVESWMRGSAS